MLEILHYQVTTNQKPLVITNKKQKDVFEYAKLSLSNANGSKVGMGLISFIQQSHAIYPSKSRLQL